MNIIGKLLIEKETYSGEITRFDARLSAPVSPVFQLQLMEIKPDAGSDFIECTENRYLDFQYSSLGIKVVQLKVVVSEIQPVDPDAPITHEEIFDYSIEVKELPETLASDGDLLAFESDILDYLPNGHSSFIRVHRRVNEFILDELDKRGLTKSNGARITYDDLADLEEFKSWAINAALAMIFGSNRNQSNDFFKEKASEYKDQALSDSHRAQLKFKKSDGGSEAVSFRSISMVRG